MTPQEELQTQLHTADTLLRRGVLIDTVKAPLFLRLVGRRWIKIRLRQMTIEELVRYSEIVGGMNLSDDELFDINISESCHIINGNALQAMEALVVAANIRIPFWNRTQTAHYLLTHIKAHNFMQGWKFFNQYNQVQDFTHTIRLMRAASNLSPMSRRS